ncbi:DUF4136 domain-containing protein [Pontibacter roseus]|uniref:DUF4136 domain-containing protein n=1 Tax=Pontibacter roseus TaxID=336989 RepID=UPI0003739D23|nr:DUF4136 domain-containing protein [Pontibacter roseus]
MTHLFLRYGWLVLVLLNFACSPSTKITSEPAPGFSLGRYQTFAFMEVDASGDGLGQKYQPHVTYLQQAIAEQLEHRGLQQSSADDADVLINLGIVVDEEVQTRQTNIQTDPPYYVGQRRYTWKSKEVEVGRYNVGTVSVHLVERARNELVWQGTAERIISDKPEKLQEQIAKGMAELVTRIPQ